jgi:hypothetical protein
MLQESARSPLAAWESFYVIVGSSGAALTGLQFVVMALVAETRNRSTTSEIDAFGTPTVVHFSAALLIAAILSAPWQAVGSAGVALGLCGAGGVVYAALTIRRARQQRGYKPVLEDWIWHAVLPTIAYATLLIAATLIVRHTAGALFTIGAMAMLLLVIGIHNAWDTVTYITLERLNAVKEKSEEGQ